MRRRTYGSTQRLAIAVGVISLLAAACGDSDSDSDSSEPDEPAPAEPETPDPTTPEPETPDPTTPETPDTVAEVETTDAPEAPVQEGPIKIGVLNPTSGNFTVFGEQSNAGIELYFEGIENTVSGREVELVFADTAGDPQQALEQARRLVDSEGVDAMIGLVNSAAALAIADFADQNEVPLIIAVGSAAGITLPENASDWVSRVSVASGQEEAPLGWYASTQLGCASAATMAWDFVSGNERAAAFGETFTAAGGEIGSEQRPPPNATEYGPFIAALDPGSTDCMYTFVVGPGSVAFFQQMEDFGVAGEIVPVGSGFVTAGILDTLGTTALGLVQSGQYTPSFDSASNAAFIADYSEKTGNEAGVYSSQGFLAAEAIALAIEALGGDTTDLSVVASSVRSLSFESHAGPIAFDENGQAIRDLYITRVVESGDGVVQEVIDTIEDVGQTWTAPG